MAPAWDRLSFDDQCVYDRMVARLVDLEMYFVDIEEGAVSVDDFYGAALEEADDIRGCLREVGLLDG